MTGHNCKFNLARHKHLFADTFDGLNSIYGTRLWMSGCPNTDIAETIMVDNLFLLAVAALGWGLSLATYRLFARSNGWPLGALQSDLPVVPVIIGIAGLLAGLAFASARGYDDGGLVIIAFGIILAAVWTGFLRVGSQIGLFLVPVVTFLLLLGWLSVPFGYAERKWATEQPAETLKRRGIMKPDSLSAPGVPTDTGQTVPSPQQ
jgi:hypothetical protein